MNNTPRDPIAHEPAKTDESNKTLSLMGGVVRPEGLPEAEEFDLGLSGGKPSRKMLTHGTMLIVIIFVIAAGTLYGMRRSQRNDGLNNYSKEAEAKVDEALARLSKPDNKDDALNPDNIRKLFKDTDEVVEVFSTDMTQRQVPVQFIKKNPFVLPVFQSADSGPDTTQDDSERARRETLEKLHRELETLELQSIMEGDRPVAIISGELIQPGQTIGSFKLTAISGITVELNSHGHTFTLQLENKADQKNTRSRRRRR